MMSKLLAVNHLIRRDKSLSNRCLHKDLLNSTKRVRLKDKNLKELRNLKNNRKNLKRHKNAHLVRIYQVQNPQTQTRARSCLANLRQTLTQKLKGHLDSFMRI